MGLLSKPLEQTKKQFKNSDDIFYPCLTRNTAVDYKGIKNLAEAVLAREVAELRLMKLLKSASYKRC